MSRRNALSRRDYQAQQSEVGGDDSRSHRQFMPFLLASQTLGPPLIVEHNPEDLLLPVLSPVTISWTLGVCFQGTRCPMMLDLDGRLWLGPSCSLAAARRSIEPSDAVRVERPADTAHGDRATNIAMQTAKAAGRAPRELAESLRARLGASSAPYVVSVEVAGPGFLNFCLDERWLHEVLRAAVTEGEAGFARPRFGEGERVQVEFVSANPTGPVHVGNGWWASYGDAVAQLLERCGYSVQREYYINDTGGQVRRLGASVLSRRAGQPVPEDGYPSGFVKGLAAAYDGPDDVVVAGRWAAERTLGFIKMQMGKINITFDSWYSQAAIEDSEAVAGTVAFLQERGLVFEEDGALWLRTGEFGDPRDKRVLRKSNGDYTYLAGDLAYHRDKFLVRGFDRVIDLWGADHQGQVASLAAGSPPWAWAPNDLKSASAR